MAQKLEEQLTDRALVTSLRCATCPACGNPKKARQTFCRRCYFKLPVHMRNATYDPLGDGYFEAVLEAMTFLGKTTFVIPMLRASGGE